MVPLFIMCGFQMLTVYSNHSKTGLVQYLNGDKNTTYAQFSNGWYHSISSPVFKWSYWPRPFYIKCPNQSPHFLVWVKMATALVNELKDRSLIMSYKYNLNLLTSFIISKIVLLLISYIYISSNPASPWCEMSLWMFP